MECHQDPKVLGLGEGILYQKAGKWVFRPTYDPIASGLSLSHPLDGYAGLDGQPFQTGYREKVRPFNRDEIDRILGVGTCLGCHSGYDDPIYRDFQASRRKFQEGAGLPCLD